VANSKIKVGAVSYLNTKPLVYAFENGAMVDEMELIFEYPSKVAQMLINNEIDIGLVPVAVIPQVTNAQIVSSFCIGATNPVASVCLFSKVPIQDIESVILDYQSRTSVALLKILLKDFWNISPDFIASEVGFEKDINGTTAGLIIGDRALLELKHFPFVYDLAEAWQKMTNLPFVFAAWVANKTLPETFITSFNLSIKDSLAQVDTIIDSIEFPDYDLNIYFKENIDYLLDDKKMEGLNLFLSKIES
jgi:chorismate dehydratase